LLEKEARDTKSTTVGRTVSVVIPLYNKERYVLRALESVLIQGHSGLEIIVVNDGSTDEGAAEVRRFAGQHPKQAIRLLQQENGGPGAARNRGLSCARGHWVCFLDADDEWGPTFLRTAFDRLERAPDSDLIALGHYRMIGNELHCHEQALRASHVSENVRFVDPSSVPPPGIKHFMDVFHTGATLCRAEVARKYGGFYERDRCTFGEDLYLWLQIVLNHPICIFPKSSMIFHVDASELSLISELAYWPTWPILTDPEPLRRTCGHHEFLEEYLGAFAIVAASWRLNANEPEKGLELLRLFPESSRHPDFEAMSAKLRGALSTRAHGARG
jgi:GT2 family glycosyltransferase